MNGTHKTMWIWKWLTAPLAMLALAAVHADVKFDPCDSHFKDYQSKPYGSPESQEAGKVWKACKKGNADQYKNDNAAKAKENPLPDKKAVFAASRNTGAASLNPIESGGWKFLMVGSDGTYAFFGSLRHAARDGSVANLELLWGAPKRFDIASLPLPLINRLAQLPWQAGNNSGGRPPEFIEAR